MNTLPSLAQAKLLMAANRGGLARRSGNETSTTFALAAVGRYDRGTAM